MEMRPVGADLYVQADKNRHPSTRATKEILDLVRGALK